MPTIDELLSHPIQHYPLATVACFDPTTDDLPRRRLDIPRLTNYLTRLADAGAPAVLIAASTGHGHLRTVDELYEWFQAAAMSITQRMMFSALLRPEDGIAANRRLAQSLAAWGYQVTYVRPGNNLPKDASDIEIAANMQPVVEAIAECGMAAGLYTIPDVSGVAMSPEAAARVVAGPGGDHVVAIKVTEADYNRSTAAFLADERLVRLKIVQGWDPYLARALQEGGERCGVTSGPMSFAVYQYLHILQAAREGDWPEVEAAQAAVSQVFRSMQDDPTKFADLQRAKHIMGLGQPLTSQVTTAQVERVFTALQTLPRPADKIRLAKSLDLMNDGPYGSQLYSLSTNH